MSATHGGDLLTIGRAFAREPASLLDFSANVNPLGPPEAVRALLAAVAEQPSILSVYPDPQARDLVAALSARHGVPEGWIAVGNGSAALLHVSIRALGTRRCVVPVPAFSEYAHALATAGAVMLPYPLRAADAFALDPERLVAFARTNGADTCIISNPHNPSGHGTPAAVLRALTGELARYECACIVDEAFADYQPALALEARALTGRMVVLRSLTKFFAVPGIRIGYGFSPEKLAKRVRAMLPSWPVGTLEQRVALAVLGETEYAQTTLRQNAAARAALTDELRALGLRVFPAAANFLLFDASPLVTETTRLRDALVRDYGIVIRTFDGLPYVRVAVRLPTENRCLIRALAMCAGKG